MSLRAGGERPVGFSARGVALAGMLHAPAGPGALAGVGLVMIPGGLVRRVGLHGLFTTAARAFAQAGAWALRFDPPGVGDSDGAPRWLTPAGLASLEARLVDEAGAALDFLEREAAPARLCVLGHCTGARSAVLRATEDRRVQAVVGWSMPLGEDDGGPLAPWVGDALRRLIGQATPSLWIYGATDPAWAGFRQFASALSPDERARLHVAWTVRAVPGANHDFTSVGWGREVVEASTRWLGDGRVDLEGSRGAAWTSA